MPHSTLITRDQMLAHKGKAITALPEGAAWSGFWPVIHPDTLAVEDVIDHNDDISDCLFVDREGEDVIHRAESAECAVRRGAILVYVCTDKETVAPYLGLEAGDPRVNTACGDFIHYMMTTVERAGFSPHPDARAAHWAGELYMDGKGVSFGVLAVRAPFEAAVRPIAEEVLRKGRKQISSQG